jgi:hypothetical protein
MTKANADDSKNFRLTGKSPEQIARFSALRYFIYDQTAVMLNNKKLNKIVEISKHIENYEHSK